MTKNSLLGGLLGLFCGWSGCFASDVGRNLIERAGEDPQAWVAELDVYLETLPPERRGRAAAGLARRLYDAEVYPAALLAYERVMADPLASDEDAAGAYLRAAAALRAMDKPREALEVMEGYRGRQGATGPNLSDLYRLRGDILAYDLDKPEEALAAYRKTYEVEEETGSVAGLSREGDADARITLLKALMTGPQQFIIEPYTTRAGETSAWVSWVSDKAFPQGRLRLEGGGEFTADSTPLRGTEDFVLHRVKLEGLTPGTAYTYTAESGGETREGRFHTARARDDDSPVRFLVYGDSQDCPRYHAQTSTVMAGEDAEFVLHTGDLVGRGTSWAHWVGQFFGPAADLFAGTVIWPTFGNHDSGVFYPQFFDGGDPSYRSFRWGNMEFFNLKSHGSGSVGSDAREQQLRWLREALEASDAEWKFAYAHYPMISPNPDGWTNWGREDFLPLMEEHGVIIMFTGHEHIYRRMAPMAGKERQPVLHITTGGAAAVGGDIGHGGMGAPIAPSPLNVTGQQSLHYCVVEVESNELRLRAVQRDGSVIDKFRLVRGEDGVLRMHDPVMDGFAEAGIANGGAKAGGDGRDIRDRTVSIKTAGAIVSMYRDLLGRDGFLPVELDAWPQADGVITGRLVLEGVPEGVRLRAFPVEDSMWRVKSDWETGGESLPVRIRLTGQPDLGPAMTRPPLRFLLAVEADGRVLPPQELEGRLTLENYQRLLVAAAADNGADLRLPARWRFATDPEEQHAQWAAEPIGDEAMEVAIDRPWADFLDHEYLGSGWYQAEFDYHPREDNGERVILELGNADESIWVYVNGELVREEPFDASKDLEAWSKPRRFDLTDALRPGSNLLSCLVRAMIGAGGLYQGALLYRTSANLLGPEDTEWDFSGWEQADNLDLRHAPGRFANRRAALVENSSAEPARLSQTLIMAPGTYTINVRFLRGFGDAAAPLRVKSRNGGADGTSADLALLPSGADWNENTLVFVWPGGTGVIEFEIPPHSRWIIDEIALRRTASQ